jgi:hypothetical protein
LQPDVFGSRPTPQEENTFFSLFLSLFFFCFFFFFFFFLSFFSLFSLKLRTLLAAAALAAAAAACTRIVFYTYPSSGSPIHVDRVWTADSPGVDAAVSKWRAAHPARSGDLTARYAFLTQGWPVDALPSTVGGTGLFATVDIAADAPVLCIPRRFVMDREVFFDAGVEHIAAALGTEDGRATAHDLAALVIARLAFDRGVDPILDEKWGAVADTWPNEMPDIGYAWAAESDDPGEDLRDVPLEPWLLRKELVDWRYEHAVVPELIARYPEVFGAPPRGAYSLSGYAYGVAVMGSRGFGFMPALRQAASPDELGWRILLPGIDIFNHPPQRTQLRDTRIQRDRTRGICVVANRRFRRGEEIFSSYATSYDQFTLPELVANFGIVPKDYDDAATRVPIVVHSDDIGGVNPPNGLFVHAPTSMMGSARLRGLVFAHVARDSVENLVALMRMVVLVKAAGKDRAVKVASRALCIGRVDFMRCGISPEVELRAHRVARSTMAHMAANIRHGSVAALDANVAARQGVAMTPRAHAVTAMRRTYLVVIEAAIRKLEDGIRRWQPPVSC